MWIPKVIAVNSLLRAKAYSPIALSRATNMERDTPTYNGTTPCCKSRCSRSRHHCLSCIPLRTMMQLSQKRGPLLST